MATAMYTQARAMITQPVRVRRDARPVRDRARSTGVRLRVRSIVLTASSEGSVVPGFQADVDVRNRRGEGRPPLGVSASTPAGVYGTSRGGRGPGVAVRQFDHRAFA